jgi:hypothetical protein
MKKSYLLLIIAMLVAVAIILSKKNSKHVPKSENPYKYELGNLDSTNAADICYIEHDSIILDLDDPKSIATDNKDHIFILGDHKLLGFDKDKNMILELNVTAGAHSLGVSNNNRFYVGYERHIEVYSKEGGKLSVWDSLSAPSMFSSIAVGPENIYVSDAGKAVLHKYDMSGNYLLTIGKKDTLKGIRGFILPSRYFDVIYSDNQIWLVNSGRHSVENYTENGDLRSYWGVTSMNVEGFCGCCNPSNIAILPNGYFVTSEKGIPRVKIYDSAGNFKCVVAGPENFTHGSFGRDIAVNSASEVLVLDSPHNKLRIFKPL